MITTTSHYSWALDVQITDLASAGLKTDSIVRMKLFTIDDALVIKKIGKLAKKDELAVQKTLQQLFRL
jgi:mRNA interferase MazF